MKKILAIEKDPLVRSECWTSECLAIMQTNLDFKVWIATHAGIYLNEKHEAIFGSINRCFRLCDFNSMLKFREIHIWKVKPENIIQTVIQEINTDNYIVIFLTKKETKYRHELVVYGFDTDRDILYTYSATNNLGEITFNEFEIMYSLTYEELKSNPENLLYFCTFFPITAVALKTDSIRDTVGIDICIAEALRTLDYEYNGSTFLTYELSDYDDPKKEKLFYSGLYCLNGMSEIINKCIIDKQYITDEIFNDLSDRIVKSMFKLNEHRKMIAVTLEWLNSLFNNNLTTELIFEYKLLQVQFNIACMLMLKFATTGDWSILTKVLQNLSNQYIKERKVIFSFLKEIRNIMKKQYLFG